MWLFLSGSPSGLRDKRLNVTGRRRDSEKPAPHIEAGKDNVDFCLRKKPLCFRHFIYVSQARLITRCGLLGCRARRGHLHRGIAGHKSCAAKNSNRPVPLRAKVHRNLFGARYFEP